jgi:hypothetical protein
MPGQPMFAAEPGGLPSRFRGKTCHWPSLILYQTGLRADHLPDSSTDWTGAGKATREDAMQSMRAMETPETKAFKHFSTFRRLFTIKKEREISDRLLRR